MMTRTQITLEPEMLRQARKRAAQLGISLAEYIRRLIGRDLGEPQRPSTPSAIFNLGNSGGSNVAYEKDAMVAEATAARYRADKNSP
jgi:hypothetical protein